MILSVGTQGVHLHSPSGLQPTAPWMRNRCICACILLCWLESQPITGRAQSQVTINAPATGPLRTAQASAHVPATELQQASRRVQRCLQLMAMAVEAGQVRGRRA